MNYKDFLILDNRYNQKEKEFIDSLIQSRNESDLLIIFKNLDKDYIVKYNKTILYYACFYFEELAHFLINNGADIFHKNDDSSYYHPLGYSGIVSVAEKLFKKGLPLNEKGSFHYPLYYAIENNKEKLALFFINNGSNLNADEFQGMSYLHKVKSVKVLSLLLNNNADINKQNVYLDTPLVYQLRMNTDFINEEKKQILIDLIVSGSNLKKENKFGDNAIDYIKRIKNRDGKRVYHFLDEYIKK